MPLLLKRSPVQSGPPSPAGVLPIASMACLPAWWFCVFSVCAVRGCGNIIVHDCQLSARAVARFASRYNRYRSGDLALESSSVTVRGTCPMLGGGVLLLLACLLDLDMPRARLNVLRSLNSPSSRIVTLAIAFGEKRLKSSAHECSRAGKCTWPSFGPWWPAT